jgi:hypothetical protein
MSERYYLYIAALEQSSRIITQLFLYALALVAAWPALEWVPVIIRRPAKYVYLSALLVIFFATVFLSSS